jgi:plasmid stabilization system protein ParE
MKPVVVLEEAVEDIEQARDFYEAQESGVGSYCADSLVADIEKLGRFHGIHSKHFGFHRMLADRFPFGIYYRETKISIEVFAVLDLRRDPTWIRAELSNRTA